MGPTQYSNPTFEQSTGAVPYNDPGVSGQNTSPNPVLDALSAAVTHAQAQVEAANKQVSSTPMYSQGASYNPTMPVPKNIPFQHSFVGNLANVQPQTRAGARAKGIGMLAAQAGNIVGKYMQKKEAEKTQNLAQDIHRSMELNQGIDEATQILAQDPNNSAAKAQLQKNQALLKALLDGKNGKQIAKAYDITFGPSAQEEQEKNAKKPEKAAMTAALKQVQQDRLQQFREQLPSQMGPNPAYIAAQKNAQDIAKQADALMKTYATMADAVYKEQNANQRTATTAAAHVQGEQIAAKSREDVEDKRVKNEIQLQKDRHADRMKEIGAQGANRMAQIKAIKKDGDNLKAQKMAEDYAKSLGGMITKTQDGLSKIEIELNKPENKVSENKANHDTLVAQKEMLTESLTQLNEQKDQAVLEMHSDPDAAAMYNLLGRDEDQ